MATVNYTRTSYQVDMVNYTGENLDEVIAFVGAANVRYEGGELWVHGELIEVNDRVAKNNADGSWHGKVKASKIGVEYTAL
jgi:hypothetical protein